MRIEIPAHAERLGAALIYNVQKVYELDGGYEVDPAFNSPFHVIRQIPYQQLHDIDKDLAIVIPIKNERLRLLEGVLTGIPHDCLPIIVSNSHLDPIDRFRMEQSMVDNFCHFAKKQYVIAHQKSPEVARLFRDGGYPHILDEDSGIVRNGKAEGMLTGIVLARLLHKKYIAFIDADNYFPGSVFEYVRLFSAGLLQSKSPYSMVRIHWHSKPKIVDTQLFFAKWGRVSRITNQYLNMFISHFTGYETDIIKTGNAGEHAMSMPLALTLDYSTGFSIETNHFVNIFEKFGGINQAIFPEIMKSGVEIFQMESRNPHFHDANKGKDHIHEMLEYSLAMLWHSDICPEHLKMEISEELSRLRIVKKRSAPVKPISYPALSNIDFEAAGKSVDWELMGNFYRG